MPRRPQTNLTGGRITPNDGQGNQKLTNWNNKRLDDFLDDLGQLEDQTDPSLDAGGDHDE